MFFIRRHSQHHNYEFVICNYALLVWGCSRLQKIGIYGGTFNPPHLGHFRGGYYAREALGLDRVLMIPDREPPHKGVPGNSALPEQRLQMVRLGIQGEGVEASDLSLERDGVSYAWQTAPPTMP